MKYRLAGATYRVIAEKLTEERAQAYADAKGISIDLAMKQGYCQMLCMTRDQAASFLTPSTKGTPSMTSAIN